jgi:peptidoglycan hydrolase CwlO-like protein
MGFMQKNVNVFLLLLVLVVAGSLAGSSVYYQKNLDRLTLKYENVSSNLSFCVADRDNYKFNLNKTLSSLSTTTQDIRRYDEIYVSKATELKVTAENLSKTSADLEETQKSLVEEAALKRKYQSEYNDQVQITNGLQEQNAILTSQKASLESTVIGYKNRIDSSHTCLESFLSNYDAGLTAAMKADAESCKK